LPPAEFLPKNITFIQLVINASHKSAAYASDNQEKISFQEPYKDIKSTVEIAIVDYLQLGCKYNNYKQKLKWYINYKQYHFYNINLWFLLHDRNLYPCSFKQAYEKMCKTHTC